MDLYMLLQPSTLENIAMNTLPDWIIAQGEKLEEATSALHQQDATAADAVLSRHIENIRHYLERNVPRVFHNKLAKGLIQRYSELENKLDLGSTSYVTKRMIETIFTKHLTILELNYYDWHNYRASLCTKSYMLAGLIEFKLEVAPAETDRPKEENEIIQIIKELPNLKHLYFKRYCTESIIRCAANSCKSIETLHTPYVLHFNDSNIDILTQFHNLTSVVFNGKAVSPSKIASLLLSCQNIELISYHLGTVMEQMSLKGSVGKHLKLKSYSSDRDTLEQIQLLAQICPMMQKVILMGGCYFYSHTNVMSLIGFQHLQELELVGQCFYHHHIKEMLQVRGCNLTDLRLLAVEQIDINALLHIDQTCPNLQALELHNVNFTKHAVLHTKKSNIPLFRNLKALTVNSSSGLVFDGSPPTTVDGQFLFLLLNCLNVESLNIGELVFHKEATLLTILDENPLIYLKRLEITIPLGRAQTLTMKVIDRILENCTNHPEAVQHIHEYPPNMLY